MSRDRGLLGMLGVIGFLVKVYMVFSAVILCASIQMSCSCTQYVPSSFLTGLYTVIEDFRDSVAKATDEN